MGNGRLGVTRLGMMTVVTAAVLAACGGEGGSTTTASVPDTTSPPASAPPTTPAPTTTNPPKPTTVPPTTTAPPTTLAPTPLESLGYPVSDDWVVETVVSGIDAGTGGLAVAPDGSFYQGDFGYAGSPGDRVLRISDDGSVETVVQSDLMASNTMTVLAPDGFIYQSSYNADRVFRIDPAGGTFEVLAEGIRGPTGIVIGDDGTVFVEAFDSDMIYKILPDGSLEEWVFDRRFNGINGLAQGPDGTLYAVDFRDGAFWSIDPDGTVEKLHQFPRALAHVVYQDGSLFITSRNAYVVIRYDLGTGEIEIIAGNGEPGDRDGRGGEASIGRPNAITIGPDGELYINHGEGNTNGPLTIRRISYEP